MAANAESVQFGPSISARVLAARGGRASPAFFVCANPFGSPHEDRAAAALAADCAASGYVAVHLAPTAWRGNTNETPDWLPAAADWIRANQASGRLHPSHVFLGGEGLGASGALNWAQAFGDGIQQSRLRAVVGINGVYGPSATEVATRVLSQERSEPPSVVLVADSERKAPTLDLGHALARSGVPFEMHLLDTGRSGLQSNAEIAEQMKRALQV
jgi:hypothetical protein